MPATQMDVVNVALSHLGESRIASMADARKEARAMLAQWDSTVEFELRSNVWNFAVARDSLPALATAPSWGFERAFELPADYLRVISVGAYDAPNSMREVGAGPFSFYKVEGNRILSDEPAPLPIRYVRRVMEVPTWDVLFRGVVELELAFRCCMELTKDKELRDRLRQDKTMAKAQAIQVGSIEQPPEERPDEAYILSRFT